MQQPQVVPSSRWSVGQELFANWKALETRAGKICQRLKWAALWLLELGLN